MDLTERERAALTAVGGGADVYDYGIATTLREMQRAGSKLVRIVRPKRAPRNGTERQPYFGAKVTAAGVKALTS